MSIIEMTNEIHEKPHKPLYISNQLKSTEAALCLLSKPND